MDTMAIDWLKTLDPARLGLDTANIDHFEIREMTDWQGDPGLAVRVVLAEPITIDKMTDEVVEPIRQAIGEAVRQAEPDWFPYISFLTLEDFLAPESTEDDEVGDAR
jgi:hypothetical protein